MKKVLLTCPPMLKQFHKYDALCRESGLEVTCAKVTQTLSVEELVKLVPQFDGWIIGDDPATREVFEAGIKGKLRAAVKWGVGVDNVDFEACKDLNIPITNIPGVFGEEVSDVAVGYIISLARQIHNIDAANKRGEWIKPCGSSLTDKKVCLVGFGDIGRCTARKLLAFNMKVYVSDPFFSKVDEVITCQDTTVLIDPSLNKVNVTNLDTCITNADYVIVTCALNKHTLKLINKTNLLKAKKGVRVINVARGPIVDEKDVCELLESGHIDAVGFDVFEIEPLSMSSKLRNYPQNIFGAHNGSNTIEGVDRTSYKAINYMKEFLS